MHIGLLSFGDHFKKVLDVRQYLTRKLFTYFLNIYHNKWLIVFFKFWVVWYFTCALLQKYVGKSILSFIYHWPYVTFSSAERCFYSCSVRLGCCNSVVSLGPESCCNYWSVYNTHLSPVLSLSWKCRLWFSWFLKAVEQLELTECVWSWSFSLCTVYRVKYCIQTSQFCCCFSVSTTDCRPNSLLSAVTLFASLLCSDFKFQNYLMYLSTFIIY